MAQYKITEIVACMRNSARMLIVADNNEPKLNRLNVKQAELLCAAADDLETRDNCMSDT
jgi:hypothetical protein